MKQNEETNIFYALYVKKHTTDEYIRVATNKNIEVLLKFINENGELGIIYQIKKIVMTYSGNEYAELLTFQLKML